MLVGEWNHCEPLYGGADTCMYQGEQNQGEPLYGGADTCMYQGVPWVRRSMVVQVQACIRVNRG